MRDDNGVRISEDIDATPPDDEAEYRRKLWLMTRESYRIARRYDRMTWAAKFFVTALVWLLGATGALYGLYEWVTHRQ